MIRAVGPISMRWLDINIGNSNRMELRSRFVVLETKASQNRAGVVRDDVFSATPPHEALRLLLSLAMTETGSGEECKVLFIDISRAHSHSPARRTIYIELPAERRVEGRCGILRKSMHSTRYAAANFASLVMKVLGSLESDVGVYGPCLARHRTRDILLFCRRDDFAVKGADGNLKWFAVGLGKALLVKFRGVLASSAGDVRDVTLLNRIITYGRDDEDRPPIEMDADPRHAAIVMATLGLKDGSKVKAVSTP